MWTQQFLRGPKSSLLAAIVALVWTAGCERITGPEPIGVCERTPEVRDAIVLEVYGVTRCEDITAEHLARIGAFGVFGLTELREGDFAGMAGLGYLIIVESRFTSLPEGVFAGLTNLRELNLSENQLASLPEGVFSGLANLEWLRLTANRLASLPKGVFADLTNLRELHLSRNQLASLPEGVFSGLTNLEQVSLRGNRLASLPDGVFSGLSNLMYLSLTNNRLASLPDGVFSGGLTSLISLSLDENRLASLPEVAFSRLSSLLYLNLDENRLDSLPERVFSGLLSLEALRLDANPGTPFELPLQFERTDSGDTAASPARVRLVLPLGAPFNMVVPLAIQGGSASTASALLSTGSIEGQVFTVTQDSPGQPTRIRASGIPSIPEEIRGIVLLVPEDIVLFSSGGN